MHIRKLVPLCGGCCRCCHPAICMPALWVTGVEPQTQQAQHVHRHAFANVLRWQQWPAPSQCNDNGPSTTQSAASVGKKLNSSQQQPSNYTLHLVERAALPAAFGRLTRAVSQAANPAGTACAPSHTRCTLPYTRSGSTEASTGRTALVAPSPAPLQIKARSIG